MRTFILLRLSKENLLIKNFFGGRSLAAEPKVFLAAIEAAVKKVIAAESDITRFDTIAGDGDAGTFVLLPSSSYDRTLKLQNSLFATGLTLKAGGEGILAKLDSDKIPSDDAALAILSIAEVVEVDMGGTSGKFDQSYPQQSRDLRS